MLKRLLLYTAIILWTGTGLIAQNLELSTDEGVLEHEEVVEVEGTIDSNLMVFEATVTNTGEDTLQVEAARVENSLVDSTVNYFCWGLCYTPSVDTATQTITIPPGDSTDTFDGDYEPQGKSGTSSISYYFYDVRNPDNKVGVEVKYVVETSGIGDENNIITDLRTYPVPADNHFNVEYNTKEHRRVRLRLSNLAGSVVHERLLNPGDKKTQINTSGLENGLYILTIRVKRTTVRTEKIIVAH